LRYKIQYENQGERAQILESNKNKFLIEEQNLIEGNYLIFSDSMPEPPEVKESQDIEYRMQKLEENMEIVIGELENLTGKVSIRA
jgi:hypothetical protein